MRVDDGVQRVARVLLRGLACGILEELEEGKARFRYDAEWLSHPRTEPISQTMPLRPEPFDAVGVHPFFLGLLPEGWLFDLALARLKLSSADPFGLVLALCADCVGAVSIVPVSAEGANG